MRRRFTAEYKRRVLEQADAVGPGGVGALLRREGLYASHLSTWRKQRAAGGQAALGPKKRGRKPGERNPLAHENERLLRENTRLQKRLQHAELIIDVQKKLSLVLGIPLGTVDSDDVNA